MIVLPLCWKTILAQISFTWKWAGKTAIKSYYVFAYELQWWQTNQASCCNSQTIVSLMQMFGLYRLPEQHQRAAFIGIQGVTIVAWIDF